MVNIVLLNKVLNFLVITIKKIVKVFEKINVVHEVNEMVMVLVEMEKIEANVDCVVLP